MFDPRGRDCTRDVGAPFLYEFHAEAKIAGAKQQLSLGQVATSRGSTNPYPPWRG